MSTPRIYSFHFPHLPTPERNFVLREAAGTIGVRAFVTKHAWTISRMVFATSDDDRLQLFANDNFANDLMRTFLIGPHDGIDWLYDLSPDDFNDNIPDIFAKLGSIVSEYLTSTRVEEEETETPAAVRSVTKRKPAKPRSKKK
jgi:hypothetical protein